MKVLHVINQLAASGAEVMLLNLATELRDFGIEQEIVTLIAGGSLVEKMRQTGIPISSLSMEQGRPSLGALIALNRRIKASQPDVILGWMYHSCVAATLAAPRRIPVIWGIHHTLSKLEQEKPLTRVLIRYGRRLKKRVSEYVYVSETSARHHFELGYPQANHEVIPNGFDLTRFQGSEAARGDIRSAIGLGEGQIVVGSAARFHPMKNHVGLIESFADVARRIPETVLLLAGRDVCETNVELQQVINREQLQGRVLLLGERSDMARVMAGIDIYVSASLWGESFPLVLGEAMASGVPCVATDLGDCAAIIGDTGQVVPPGDKKALSEAMLWMVEQGPEVRRRLGIAARRRVEENYALRKVAAQYLELFRRASSERLPYAN